MDLEHFKSLLIARRNDLLALEASAKEGEKPVELDQQSVGRLSRMDALQMQSMSLATKQRRADELKRVERALSLFDGDDYGYCVSCGEEIAAKRLELDPSILTCVTCASQ